MMIASEGSPQSVESLIDFLTITDNLFEDIVSNWSFILFKETYREPIREAWREVKGYFSQLRNDIVNGLIDLSDAGLAAGKQLQLKLKGFGDAWRRFKEEGTIEFLKKLLGWINVILGSLATVIPVGEALKEFKETLEQLMDS